MKKLIGFAILGLSFSIPAHAQQAIGGTSISGGSIRFQTLPSFPRAQFQVVDVSGEDALFFPSSFVQFEEGITKGQVVLAEKRKSLGEAALEYRHAERPKAKVTITQDAFGNAIIERQQ